MKNNCVFKIGSKLMRKVALLHIFANLFNVWLSGIRLYSTTYCYIHSVLISRHVASRKLYCTLVRE